MLEIAPYKNLAMYTYFTEPDYVKSANDLKSLNDEIEAQSNRLKNEKDPNAPREPLEPVSEIIPRTSNNIGGLENTFDLSKTDKEFEPALKIPNIKSDSESNSNSKDTENKLAFLGEKGQDPIGNSMAFGNDILTTAQTDTPNAGAGIANSLKMGLSGAKAGMAIGGPFGAAIGGAAGVIYGGIDAAMDIKKGLKKKVDDQRDKDEELVQARKQGQRTEDGLDSLTKLTAIRKQQQSILT